MKAIFVTILMFCQLSGIVVKGHPGHHTEGYQCCHSASSLDKIEKKYLDKWDDSKKSMGAELTKYQKNVSKAKTRECSQKDINAVKDGTGTVVKQVSRITDGCGQSLRQAILTAQYIERLANSKKSQEACNALGEAIDAIISATKQIQRCQDKFHDTINAAVCGSSEEIDEIYSENIGDEIFFNFVNLSIKISAAGNAFEKCKAAVLEALAKKLNTLLNEAEGCGSNKDNIISLFQ